MKPLIEVSCAALLFVFVASAGAQSVGFVPDLNTYGTKDESIHLLSGAAFVPFESTTTYTRDAFYNRHVTNGNGCCLLAPVTLPSGAVVTGFEIEGCDNSTTGHIEAILFDCVVPAQVCLIASTVLTGVASAPGCSLFRSNVTGVTINNAIYSYFVQFWNVSDTSGAVTLRAARIYYKLQVSPAPAVATFSDVPATHPFYQYIEALAASGVSSGCASTPPQFCPDAPVTRGQMAVFLARALGLHWVP